MIFHTFLLLCLHLIAINSSCPSFTYLNSTCLPCSTTCLTCSTSITCTVCAPGYYLNSNATCSKCTSNCQVCTSTTCTSCTQPYILINNVCQPCNVPNAAICSSISTVQTCLKGYYSSSSFCGSCPLHCSRCVNSTYCSTCESGYFLQYQNSLCSACSNCSSCSVTATNCTSCLNGYKLLSSSCVLSVCNIVNCAYCSADNICGNCNKNYYLLNNNCFLGSSILCQNGASGTWPTQCKSCSYNSYIGSTSSNGDIYCIPYSTLQSGTVNQLYYYMFNDYSTLYPLSTLTSSCGDQSFILNPLDISLNIGNYYSVTITFKGYSLSSSTLTVNLTDNNNLQLTSIPLSGSCQPVIFSIKTTTLNTNPLTIKFIDAQNFGLIELLITNKLCSSGCVKCLNKELCIQCQSPNYLLNYLCVSDCGNYYRLNQSNILSCVISCPDGFYPQGNQCQPCLPPCKTCYNASLCFSCSNVSQVQYYYMSLNNTCLIQCPDKYFVDANNCSPCVSPCSLCLSQTTCLSCIQGFWNGTNCAAQCPVGTYASSELNSCQNCNGCQTCINSSTICTSCSNGLILFDNTCISTCSSGYYQSGSSCLRCVSPCLACISPSSCLSCSFGYLSGTSCISSCPKGSYADIMTQTCKICNPNCSACISETQCTSCASNYCLQLSTCITSALGCSDTYYPITINSECVCTPCSYPCKLCTSQTSCLSCISGYLSGTNCIPTCPTSFYGNTSSQQCLGCSNLFSNCLECSEFVCTSCQSNYLYNQFGVNGQYCVSTCPPQLYNKSNSCVYCIAPCKNCASSTLCLDCIDGFAFNNGNCVLKCNVGQYLQNLTIGSTCKSCQSPCKTCSSSSECLSCVRTNSASTQKYLYQSSCIACPSGYYSSLVTLECEKCLYPCLTCSSQTACLSCIIGFYNSTSQTCSQCSPGKYPDTSTMTCLSCKANCTVCSNATDCSHCVNNTYLKSFNCITSSECQSYSGYYVNTLTSTCSLCVTPCLTCSNQTQCTSCLSGYMYFNNSCIVVCPRGYYNNVTIGSCSQCPSQCTTCTSSTICLTCQPSYFYYKNQLSCLSDCPLKTYKVSMQCLDCKYPCLQCTSEQSCISCQSGILLETNKSCITTCPSNFFSLNSNCEKCDSSCFQCSKTSTNCTSCSSGTYLHNNLCLTSCPDGYFGDVQASTCFLCVAPCQYCVDQITCTKCSDDYSYIVAINQCTLVCPASYFLVNNTDNSPSASKHLCVSCKIECMTCSSPTTCDLCINGSQYLGTCLTECPQKMFSQNGICNNCSLPCYNCSSTTVCKSCPPNQGYLLVASTQCFFTNTCPIGYYLQPSGSQCETFCPITYYKQSITRTCLTQCPSNYFKGTDASCYEACPFDTYGNSTYFCDDCQGQCPNPLLFFTLSSNLKFDDLYLQIKFTVPPIFSSTINNANILLQPSIPFKIHQQGQDFIILHLQPTNSIKPTRLSVRFLQPFSIFSNQLPLQNPKVSLQFSGYNLYSVGLPNLESLGTAIGIISSLVCIWRGYLGLDFVQGIFLFNLVNIHYPPHLSSFLQGFKSSHFYFKILSANAPQIQKFGYVVENMSLIQNSLYALVLISIFMCISIVLSIIQHVRGKKIQPTSSQNRITSQSSQVSIWKKLNFYQIFRIYLPNIIFYALFTYSALFSICELYNWKQSNQLFSLTSRYISPLILVLLVSFPIILLFTIEPKPLLFSVLLLRKFIICIILVVVMDYPIFIFGFMAVIALSTFILLLTNNPCQWKVEFIVNSVGEGAQLLLACLFSVFTFYQEGTETNNKVNIGFAIIIIASLGILCYVVLNCIMISCWVIKIVTGKDYIEIWSKIEQKGPSIQEPESQNDSASVLKLRSSKNRIGSNVLQSDVILQVDKQEEESARHQQVEEDVSNPDFRVYSDNQQKSQDSRIEKAPEFLMKVVNQFDDYGMQG